MYVEVIGEMIRATLNGKELRRSIDKFTANDIVNILSHYSEAKHTNGRIVFVVKEGNTTLIEFYLRTVLDKPSLSALGYVRGLHSTLTVLRRADPHFHHSAYTTTHSLLANNVDYFYGVISDEMLSTNTPTYFEDYLYAAQEGRREKIPLVKAEDYLSVLEHNLNLNHERIDPVKAVTHGIGVVMGFMDKVGLNPLLLSEVGTECSTLKEAIEDVSRTRGAIHAILD